MRKAGLALISVVLAACSAPDATSPRTNASTLTRSQNGEGSEAAGTVYTLTNDLAGNAVRLFSRADDGSLAFVADYPTGGTGTGAGLGNQGALAFADDGRILLAISPGSNQLSSFRIVDGALELVDTQSSGGHTPISVTSSGALAFVLNAGGDGNITGFRIEEGGRLAPIAGSTRPLSSSSAGPAQIAFNPAGTTLVVTEKATSRILTFSVGDDGQPGEGVVTKSSGETPFGFAFTNGGLLVVSEAFAGAAGASAASSYDLDHAARLVTRSASVASSQSAACWVAISPYNHFAYFTNTGSNTISRYVIRQGGSLELLDGGVSATTGGSPTDAAFSGDGRQLYVLNSSGRSISAYAVAADGSLTPTGTTSGLSVGAVGLLAR